MASMTLQIGDFWYSDVEYGPPLPHSLWLWEQYGCYEHYNCVCLANLLTPKGEKYDKYTKHVPLDQLKNQYLKCSDTCECFIHWLLGDMAHKDYPQTYEPIINQVKKGKKNAE